MPDQCCGDPKLPPSGGTPDVSSATGVLPVAHGGTGADLSNSAAAKVLATPPGATGPVALRTLAAEHLPAHAASHKAGGADALLAAPGPIGGGTPDTIDATTVTATEFIGDGSQLTNLPSGGGFSPVDYAIKRLTGGIGAGSWTIGVRFLLTLTKTINLRFAWPTTGANSVVVDLWQGGSVVATATVAVNAAGFYIATIDYAIGDADLYKEYHATTHIPTGGYISYNAGGGNVPLNTPLVGAPGILYLNLGGQAANHAQPNNFQTSEFSAIEVVPS